jgi:hypothetical protein
MRKMARRLLAYVALFGMLLASVPALADSFSASELSACCNTLYCPLHHRQSQDLQKDKSICDLQGHSKGNDCSMRACDTAPSPVVEIAPFVLVAPLAIGYQSELESAPVPAPNFFPFNVSIPSTPPPRVLPS